MAQGRESDFEREASNARLQEQIAHEALRHDPPYGGVAQLTPVLCEDWAIYARDREGNAYYVSTEVWSEWLDAGKGADRERNAIEIHMLPVAWEKGYFHHPGWWQRVDPQYVDDLPREPLGGVAFWDQPPIYSNSKRRTESAIEMAPQHESLTL